MLEIANAFPITEEEYSQLDKKFGQLVEFAAWQLFKKNSRNNHTDEQSDISQELKISLLRAGSYYKRQTYIISCLNACCRSVSDKFSQKIVQELLDLWSNKTRHGANRQKFGPHQEKILECLVQKYVPISHRPSRDLPLKLDATFSAYCKAIAWNAQKSLGKKITKEKSLRTSLVSLSEYDYLGAVG